MRSEGFSNLFYLYASIVIVESYKIVEKKVTPALATALSLVDNIVSSSSIWNDQKTLSFGLLQLERRDAAASQTLRAALTKAEQTHPGLSYEIVMGILKKGDLNVNMNESILRLQGSASETDCKYIVDRMMAMPEKIPNIFASYSSGISFESNGRSLPRTEQEIGIAKTNIEQNSRRDQRPEEVLRDNKVRQRNRSGSLLILFF